MSAQTQAVGTGPEARPRTSGWMRMVDVRDSRLDTQGNRVIEIALPVLETHPGLVARRWGKGRTPELRYEVRQGKHVKRGAIERGRSSFELCFEQGRDPDGIWELRIESRNGARRAPRELWRQRLFVQKRLRLDHDRIRELAERHAPIFVFGADERYFPVSLATLLGAPELKKSRETMKVKTVFGKQRVPLAELGDFMRYNGHSEYLLDFNVLRMWLSIFTQLGGSPHDATVYYSYFEDPDSDRFFIDYHLIYAFDTKAGMSERTGIGPHVFDRESMLLVFEGGDQPSSMIISGHLENQTIAFLKKLKTWTQGRIRVPYDDPATLRLRSHPVIAVAQGSHALYPTSGVYQLALLRELAGYLDPQLLSDDVGGARHARPLEPTQVITPPGVRSKALPGYHLASLGLDRLTSRLQPDARDYDGHNAYLTFSGYWVDVPGRRNARFPPFTDRINDIGQWVDGAYPWDWDDLPERYHHNNGLILKFLHENLEDF